MTGNNLAISMMRRQSRRGANTRGLQRRCHPAGSWRLLVCAVTAWTTVPSASALGQDTTEIRQAPDTLQLFELEPLLVRGRLDDLSGQVSSASVGFVGHRDLRVRPLAREGELLETVPGMILTQHSGGGKSNQMFVRGFNLDHGTDFSTRLEGMPLNIASHAHGQGYTDINFITPELVDHIEYALGNYYAHIGDFGSAGEANVRMRRTIDRPFVKVGVGANGHRRMVAGASSALGHSGTLTMGGEVRRYDGPWVLPEDLAKFSALARYSRDTPGNSVSLLALAYSNSWQATDQIPWRKVLDGSLDRFAAIDPTLGGHSSRYSLSGSMTHSAGDQTLQLDAWAIRYGLDLYSNFTYLLDQPESGDQIRQDDEGRWTVGASASWFQPLRGLGRDHELTVGTQLRGDWAEVGLSRTQDRAVIGLVRRDGVRQLSAGLYGELLSRWSPTIRSTLGLRTDGYAFDVAANRDENGGSVTDAIVSPKASLIFGPWSGTELYLGGGFGFHSNDARGVVASTDPVTNEPILPVDPLVQSRGGEVGLRATPLSGLRTTLAFWGLDLDSELLYVGDAGRTEPSGASRRWGVTLTNFYRLNRAWTGDLDVSFANAQFRDAPPTAAKIPGALERVIAAGFSHEPDGNGILAGVRVRHFGSYPLTEDGGVRAEANTLVNVNTGFQLGPGRLTLSVLNAFDEMHSDIQYYYTSRLAGEPLDGVADVHFHPAEPRQIRLGFTWEF